MEAKTEMMKSEQSSEQSLFNYLSNNAKLFRTTVFASSLIGILSGGLIGARWAADKFVQMHQHSKFTHPMQAHRERHTAILFGFTSQGAKWGLRMATFSGVWSGTYTVLSFYRPNYNFTNVVVSGSVAGVAYQLTRTRGIKPAVAGLALGGLCSIPLAIVAKCFTSVIPDGQS